MYCHIERSQKLKVDDFALIAYRIDTKPKNIQTTQLQVNISNKIIKN